MIKLSVIIPTYNNYWVLERTLEALDKQSISRKYFEVVVVDDGSNPEHVKLLKKYASDHPNKLRLFCQKNKGPAAARNLGIRNAKGRIILIINDDTIPDSELLQKHLSFHSRHNKTNLALLGYTTWHPELEITPFMKWLEHGGPYFSYYKIVGKKAGWDRFWTCNISLKRNFLLQVGSFDESFPDAAWEDIELGYRLHLRGLDLRFDEKAKGYHYHPTSINRIKRKMEANGRSALIIKDKVPVSLLVPMLEHPQIFIAIERYLFVKPVVWLLERISLYAEKRLNLSYIYGLLLLHYRLKAFLLATKTSQAMSNYRHSLKEEKEEWKCFEKESLMNGVPWWVDLRNASTNGRNLFWRIDPKKDNIVRGKYKEEVIDLTLKKGGRVLDLACGSGWLSLELARRGLEVTGIDLSPDRIRIANGLKAVNRTKNGFGKLHYKSGDINKIGLPSKYYDSIVVWDSLHHFPNLDDVLKRVTASLKGDGQIVCYDHQGSVILKSAEKIKNVFTPKSKRDKHLAHEDILGKEIINLLDKYFHRINYETHLSFPFSAALYLILSKDLFTFSLKSLTQIDNILCKLHLFQGEYFFYRGKINEGK